MIEIIFVIAIAVILAKLGLPGFKDTIDRNGRESAMQDVISAIGRARSEAATQSRSVSVCRATTSTACAGSSGGDWNDGWIIFTDAGTAGTVDGSDTVLQVHGVSNGQSKIVLLTRNNGSFTGDYLSFDNSGFLQNTTSATGAGAYFRFCAIDKTLSKARAIWLSATGRPTLAPKDTTDNIYNDLAGANLACP